MTERNDELVVKIIVIAFPTWSGRTKYMVITQRTFFCSPSLYCRPLLAWLSALWDQPACPSWWYVNMLHHK